MNKQYVIILILMLAIVAALSVPASAFWWPNGLPLSDYSYCNADPECNCTVWENITVANGSYNIDLISGIIPEDYNYTFSVPWYDDLMLCRGLRGCIDGWLRNDEFYV